MNLIFYKPNLLALHNGLNSQKAVIFISGMFGNLLTPRYVINIYNFCTENNLFFIQPQLRSFPNYGLATIDTDVEDINDLIDFFSLTEIIFIGHSTGCQDIIYTLKFSNINVKLAILQGPVSDREAEIDDLSEVINIVKSSDNDIFIYKNVPILKRRFLSLYEKNGKDDIFSSDLEVFHYKSLNPNNVFIYFVVSKDDEYVFVSNKHKLAMVPNSKIVEVEGNHGLTGNELTFVQIIKDIFIEHRIIH
ncbi:UPF0613 protein PB24D3.06c [Dictyocoela roeselum]|nr:UPF0613 protein PB24D3.06c [Dictyocoela roeselum]